MRNIARNDFRTTFGEMDDLAIITLHELAELLGTTSTAVSQLGYRGELPQRAFLGKQKSRACWFVGDIRRWLTQIATSRSTSAGTPPKEIDFRSTFATMDDFAIVTVKELAQLLATTPDAISQRKYRGELPPTAFAGRRLAQWFVKDIRKYLREMSRIATPLSPDAPPNRKGSRIGRPRTVRTLLLYLMLDDIFLKN